MASEFYTIEEKAEKKLKKLRNSREEETKTFRYKRLIAAMVKVAIRNNSLRFTQNDIKEISLIVYKSYNKLKHIRVWNQMTSELVKKDVNTALIEFYSSAGLDKNEATALLKLATETAKEKKDVTNMLKIVEKYENAANLTQKSIITARTTETIDYSKLVDGQPSQKVVKTLEISKNEAQGLIETVDNEQGNDNVQPGNNV